MNKFELLQCDNGWVLISSWRPDGSNAQHAVKSKKVFTELNDVLNDIQASANEDHG